ncbi:GHKL domain-containing protein [Ligilactobacillus murinus]|uniref:GHKL domain-containing protein n=1 Tax=Ligilactobacillus murinus TaxID=1622 RepID=UPI0013A6D945|nr:GHKL domain-containing protein [Ligilactobacillus murinus]
MIKQYQHKKDLEEQRRNLEAYMRELELNQRKLRKFKHDYQNMLLILEESIRAGKSEQALQQLAKYSQKNFTDKLLWRFNDVDNIKDLQLKSIFINKLNILFSYDIKVDFECRQEIKTPVHLDTFDLVRIIGIVLDNAIEESRILGASAHVQMALYQTEGVLEIMLKNSCRHEKVELAQIENASYSTKAGHYGVGLTTVREIVSDYNNIFIEYTSAKHEFAFEMKVVLEER